jgi:hypothetical protein
MKTNRREDLEKAERLVENVLDTYNERMLDNAVECLCEEPEAVRALCEKYIELREAEILKAPPVPPQ